MDGYPNLTKIQLQMKVGRTKRLYEAGKTPEEIAEVIKSPVEDVKKWILMIIEANNKKPKIKG